MKDSGPTLQRNLAQNASTDLTPPKRDRPRRAYERTTEELDLAHASIVAPSVQRVAVQPQRRSWRERAGLKSSTSPSLLTKTDASPTPVGGASRVTPLRRGIFKNPYYAYRGGVVSKIITFFANLLKVLEKILLTALGAGQIVNPIGPKSPILGPQKEAIPQKEKKRDSGLHVHRQ